MFEPGDVVRFHSANAGKEKFHLCLGENSGNLIYLFLNINSKTGFAGDCVLEDGRIPGLPKSKTGSSVVSFSMVIRRSSEKLKLLGAVKTGKIDKELVGELLAFANSTRALADIDKPLVVEALDAMLT
ncbi:MAG: hypothetical protein AAFY35_03800 [Pseudomonadota bacterium]